MQVIKRNGHKQNVILDKITKRISNLLTLTPSIENTERCSFLGHLDLDSMKVALKVVEGVYDGVKTVELDNLAAEVSASMTIIHPDYAILAARIAISNLQKETKKTFSDSIYQLASVQLIDKKIINIVQNNESFINSMIVDYRDFNFDYFGFKTLEKSYLLRIDNKIVERPQYMFMRVALGIHGEKLDDVKTTYDLMSQKYFTHATPTLFNAGTPKPQMSSCFLLKMSEDSISGIYKTLSDCAKISQHAGGIGLSIHNIRATGSYIAGTNGVSNGIVPMLRVFNDTARYVDQGGGKRKGSCAIYLEPWHLDIFEFLDLKKNSGAEERRARDLFYALWIPDLFMKRVIENKNWSLMCPNECKFLDETYGQQFEELYIKYEKEGKAKKTISAQYLWEKIIISQIETGTPYILYKDSINQKNNQKNLGTIKSSNLCTEIMEYTDSNEIAVCNLASICLPMFVTASKSKDSTCEAGFRGSINVENLKKEEYEFDHDKFCSIVKIITKNLNKIIDNTFYPLPEAKQSNLKHRPIGIGVQGLADLFMLLKIPFTSIKAKKLNKEIFETLYYAALEASTELAIDDGPYSSFHGSPLSMGLFQFDLSSDLKGVQSAFSGRWDWEILRNNIQKYGIRNSLLIALMPTASTSQIMGNNDAFEPFTSNLYTRRVLSGEFIVVNKYLFNDLHKLNLWNKETTEILIRDNGSVKNMLISQEMKDLYKTVWEIKMKDIIDMASDRSLFIDQSQSMNLFVEFPTIDKISSMHAYSWKKGLKTGMYYLRTKSATNATKVTIPPEKETQCNDEICFVCSS